MAGSFVPQGPRIEAFRQLADGLHRQVRAEPENRARGDFDRMRGLCVAATSSKPAARAVHRVAVDVPGRDACNAPTRNNRRRCPVDRARRAGAHQQVQQHVLPASTDGPTRHLLVVDEVHLARQAARWPPCAFQACAARRRRLPVQPPGTLVKHPGKAHNPHNHRRTPVVAVTNQIKHRSL